MRRIALHALTTFFRTVLPVVVAINLAPPVEGEEPRARETDAAVGEKQRQFVLGVLPVLREKCFSCHGEDAEARESELRLDSRKAMLSGGESGESVLDPSVPEQSLLYRAITWTDLEMPPKENDRLTPQQIAAVRDWIAGGAVWPAAEQIAQIEASNSSGGVRVATRDGLSAGWTNRLYQPQDLWAFQPLQDARPPVTSTGQHPIDAFIDQRIANAGLQSGPTADRANLIRRATLDLTGLPPTQEEVQRFVGDKNPLAREHLVDRLLASKRYGERWAQHWLDVVRYADSAGYANDFQRPHAWRYRDYVIRSFNEDKPYDRFVQEQIAGDELDPSDPDCLLATGFLRMGPWEHTGMAVESVTRQSFLDDVTNAVGETFLGVNMSCFRCHDHKFDPFPTQDYYRFQAIFAPTQFGDRPLDFQSYENTSEFHSGTSRARSQLNEAQGFLDSLDAKTAAARKQLLLKYGVDSVDELSPEVRRMHDRFAGLSDLEKSLNKITRKRLAYFQRELASFRPFAYSVYDGPFPGYNGIQNQATIEMPKAGQGQGSVQPVHVLLGGSLKRPAEEVAPGVLSAVMPQWEVPPDTHGRRLALARWLTHPNNPVPARVIVNRVWQHHFGRGLFATPSAIGKMGAKPTHPQLLDYLARWLIQNDWSIKGLHRLIMTSDAYARSADVPQAARDQDPANALLTYYEPRRLTAEEMRDGLLAATGELNLDMGGPGCLPEINWDVALQPRQIMGTVAPAYQPSTTPRQRNRRTIYAIRTRTLPDPMLAVFNRPGEDLSCAVRDETIVTPQVLTLLNGQFVHDRAIALAHRITETHSGKSSQVEQVFRQLLAREPTPTESEKCVRHLDAMLAHHQSLQITAVPVPTIAKRGMVEELTGNLYQFDDELTLMRDYVSDLKPWQVEPPTRALAELCLVLINSNEFAYVY